MDKCEAYLRINNYQDHQKMDFFKVVFDPNLIIGVLNDEIIEYKSQIYQTLELALSNSIHGNLSLEAKQQIDLLLREKHNTVFPNLFIEDVCNSISQVELTKEIIFYLQQLNHNKESNEFRCALAIALFIQINAQFLISDIDINEIKAIVKQMKLTENQLRKINVINTQDFLDWYDTGILERKEPNYYSLFQ